jgi:hypothetical protein
MRSGSFFYENECFSSDVLAGRHSLASALALFLMVNGVCKYLFTKDHQLHVQWPQRASVAAWIRDEKAKSPQLIGEILLARAAHSEGDEVQ